MLIIISYGILLLGCFSVCAGVRHYQHLQKMQVNVGYKGVPVSISSNRIIDKFDSWFNMYFILNIWSGRYSSIYLIIYTYLNSKQGGCWKAKVNSNNKTEKNTNNGYKSSEKAANPSSTTPKQTSNSWWNTMATCRSKKRKQPTPNQTNTWNHASWGTPSKTKVSSSAPTSSASSQKITQSDNINQRSSPTHTSKFPPRRRLKQWWAPDDFNADHLLCL